MSVEFLLTALLVAALPGPGVIYTLSNGVAHGAGAAVLAATGCVLGVLPYAIAVSAGLGAELAANSIFFEAVKWAGVAYLAYMAVRTWRDRSKFQLREDPRPRTVAQLLGYGALVSLLNPKIPIFFYAFFPRFAGPEGALPLSVAFVLIVLIVYVAYGVLAATLRNRILARPAGAAWTRRIFSGAYTLIAARLALQVR